MQTINITPNPRILEVITNNPMPPINAICELIDNGIEARPAKKGKDSVNFGIQWLQQQTSIIDAQCINTKNEFMQYKWKEDKDGNAIRQPVEKNNHIIDASRYAYEDDMEESWYMT